MLPKVKASTRLLDNPQIFKILLSIETDPDWTNEVDKVDKILG